MVQLQQRLEAPRDVDRVGSEWKALTVALLLPVLPGTERVGSQDRRAQNRAHFPPAVGVGRRKNATHVLLSRRTPVRGKGEGPVYYVILREPTWSRIKLSYSTRSCIAREEMGRGKKTASGETVDHRIR